MRRSTWALVGIGVLIVAVAAGWPYIEHYSLTGSFVPIDIVDALTNPVSVTSRSSDALIARNGTRIGLPDVVRLPEDSAVLDNAISRGVEVATDGRVYGLVRIHHWCGNDPVRTHLARVDIARMLRFLGEGEHLGGPDILACRGERRSGGFMEHGWNVSHYLSYLHWVLVIEYEEERAEVESGVAAP